MMKQVFKTKIFVTLKKSVLDPQGQTILQALHHMNLSEVSSCRVGKFFEKEIEAGSKDEAARKLGTAAKDILSNPVIEDYSIEIL